MALAPIGVFCLISRTFANIGFSAFIPLAKYMIGVLLALAIQCFGVYQILLKIFTGLNPIKFIKKFFPVMAFAFSTATSNATIPMSIDTLSKKVGVSKKISSFTIPLGATINMDGTSIMQGVAVVFAAQAFGIHLSMTDYITVIGTATLASVGTAGVPSVGLVTLTMVFNSVGLPVEAIGLICSRKSSRSRESEKEIIRICSASDTSYTSAYSNIRSVSLRISSVFCRQRST